MNITIDKKIKELTPDFHIGVLQCSVSVNQNNKVDKLIEDLENNLSKKYKIEDVVQLPVIIDGRNAYKKYGKDPSRYRLATESLYRRIVKGNKLYRINNVVDLGNVLSLKTRKSIAVLDQDKIQGDILIRLGTKNDNYFGIGRGKINIENIPLYEDDIGPFGSVTSDTQRTMINPDTKNILIFIISFNGKADIKSEITLAKNLYAQHANGHDFTSKII